MRINNSNIIAGRKSNDNDTNNNNPRIGTIDVSLLIQHPHPLVAVDTPVVTDVSIQACGPEGTQDHLYHRIEEIRMDCNNEIKREQNNKKSTENSPKSKTKNLRGDFFLDMHFPYKPYTLRVCRTLLERYCRGIDGGDGDR